MYIITAMCCDDLNGCCGSVPDVAVKPIDFEYNRRRFIKTFCLGTFSLGFFAEQTPLWAQISRTPFSGVGTFRLNVSSFPVLSNDFGSIRIKVTGMPISFPQVVITRLAGNQFATVTSKCTHMGNTVNPYSVVANGIVCPVHFSKFSATGAVINGPALTPLTRYATTFDGADRISVEIPGLGYGVEISTAPVGSRLKLIFPTTSGVKYEVRFRRIAEGTTWTTVPFATTPTDPLSAMVLSGSSGLSTVYVENPGEAGFFTVARY